jgi:hypothetical protein
VVPSGIDPDIYIRNKFIPLRIIYLKMAYGDGNMWEVDKDNKKLLWFGV